MSTELLKTDPPASRSSTRGEPTWEIARVFPRQGEWTEDTYLELSGSKFVELDDGCLEVLAMPSPLHQAIVGVLYELLQRYLRESDAGRAFFAPMPIRLWQEQLREPDLVVLLKDSLARLQAAGMNSPPEGADLVMEVVSPGEESRRRDLVVKRELYARARIPEYWIVDPETRTVKVLVLDGNAYRAQGEFQDVGVATSVLLPGFSVDLPVLFADAR